jgi:general secretion pathway protein A
MATIERTDRTTGQAAFLEFYGLREQPFGVTPDPRFLYLAPSHGEALASLVYAIETKRGFSALIAEPGMGKTSLLFHLLDKIKSSARTAFLFRPDSNTKELLQSLLTDLGIEAFAQDVPRMHEMLNSVLLDELNAGRKFVWVIDEAQDLDSEVLESVRLLSNFETPASKLMHIVLAGQTALSEKLARPELVQLRQRVSTLVRLEPLSTAETSHYIQHRAWLAGCTNENLFTYESRMLIAHASQGIPRNINNLCFSCLSLGFVEHRKEIEPSIVQEALADQEIDFSKAKASEPPPAYAPRELFDIPFSFSEPNSQPRGSQLWVGLAIFAFIVIPLLLIVVESNSRVDALEVIRGTKGEDIVSKLTGGDVHLPDPPNVNPPSLQPPAVPKWLEDEEKRSSTVGPTDAQADNASLGTPVQSQRGVGLRRRTIRTLAPRPKPAPSRVVYARGGENFNILAFDYYGKSNPSILAQLRAHNPQIKETYPSLKAGQPVVLPDLAPQFPWKGSAAYASHPSSPN